MTENSPFFHGFTEQGSKNSRGADLVVPIDLQRLPLDHQTQLDVVRIRNDLIRAANVKSSAGKQLTLVSLDIYYKLARIPQDPFGLGVQLGMNRKQVKNTMVRYAAASNLVMSARGATVSAIGYLGPVDLIKSQCASYGGITSEMADNIHDYSVELIMSSGVDLSRRSPQIGAAALIGHFFLINGYTVTANDICARLGISDVGWVAEIMTTLGFAESSRNTRQPQEPASYAYSAWQA